MTALRDSLHNQNVKAFLAVIRAGEGTADEDGYRRHFGGELFTDFSQHPKRAITKLLGGQPITSTAAGAYQFLSKTWSECQGALYLPDFSPASQDLAAVFLIDRRGALEAVVRGDLETAIQAASYGLRDAADQYIAGLYTGADSTNQIGTVSVTTAALAYTQLRKLSVKLDEANVPQEGRWVVVPPWYHGLLLEEDKFVRVDASGTDQGLRNGIIGRLRRRRRRR